MSKINVEGIRRDIAIQGKKLNAKSKSIHEIFDRLLEHVRQVNFRELMGVGTNEKIAIKAYVVGVIDTLLAIATEQKWDLATYNSLVYLFDGCKWVSVTDEIFKRFLQAAALKMGVPVTDGKFYRIQDELFKQFMASTSLLAPDAVRSDMVLVNMANGTFEITMQQRQFRDFKKEDFLRYQLPFTYDADATCPKFQAFLDEVLPEKESQMILSEYVGYLFTRELKLEKVLILFGDGANGKSVVFSIISALIGAENVSSFTLQGLTQNEYQRAEIGNKLLNYSSEMNPSRFDIALFKQIVSGEPIQARFIYGRAFIMKDYAKLILNCNVLPSHTESTEAFFRRFIVVPFNVTIPAAQQDPDLASKIIENELPGIFNWVLAGLERVISNRRFTESPAVTETIKSYREMSDTLSLFIQEYGIEGSNTKHMRATDIYCIYAKFCRDCNLEALAVNAFGMAMRKKGFEKKKMATGSYYYVTFRTELTSQ